MVGVASSGKEQKARSPKSEPTPRCRFCRPMIAASRFYVRLRSKCWYRHFDLPLARSLSATITTTTVLLLLLFHCWAYQYHHHPHQVCCISWFVVWVTAASEKNQGSYYQSHPPLVDLLFHPTSQLHLSPFSNGFSAAASCLHDGHVTVTPTAAENKSINNNLGFVYNRSCGFCISHLHVATFEWVEPRIGFCFVLFFLKLSQSSHLILILSLIASVLDIHACCVYDTHPAVCEHVFCSCFSWISGDMHTKYVCKHSYGSRKGDVGCERGCALIRSRSVCSFAGPGLHSYVEKYICAYIVHERNHTFCFFVT